MKIAPLRATDPWFHRVLADQRTQADMLRGVPVDGVVEMEQVEVLHHGPELNYRPYLHLTGVLETIQPEVVLPYGISELSFRQGEGLVVDAFYEFDNDQLADLVAKDYFGPNFRVPAAMTGIPWTLPGTADFLVVAPEYENEVPLVFVGFQDQSDLQLTEENSGYNLAEYFPDFTAPENIIKQQDLYTRSGEMRDMFAADELGAQTEAEQQSSSVPIGVFDQLVVQLEEERTREEDLAVAQRVYDPRSAEGMYHTRIGPGVDEALASAKHADQPAAPDPNADESGLFFQVEEPQLSDEGEGHGASR